MLGTSAQKFQSLTQLLLMTQKVKFCKYKNITTDN